MAALVAGQQYGLSAQDKINSTKSLIFVKLTDSALKSIEEYVKNKADTISRPTIQFQNSNGVISIPQNGSRMTYGFTVSNVEADGPQGSFECLQQPKHRSLESLGCMDMKMHIHANEDSYENTRVRMAAVEKEHKMACTKVIKVTGSHLGRKVKVKRPSLVVSPLKNSPPTISMISYKKVLPPVAPPHRKPEPPSAKVKPAVKNPELLRQPIRDRIVHILAVRPYKRPELLVRLMNEGIQEKDKNKIASILPQLSTLKGNIYYLANYLWNEVQDNWKFCSSEELEIIRKKKQQHLSTSMETDAPTIQSNNPPLKKRVISEPEVNGNPRPKKQRISHYKGAGERVPHSGVPVETFRSAKKSSPEEESSHKSLPDDSSASLPKTHNHCPTSRTREEGEKSIRSHTSGLGHASPQVSPKAALPDSFQSKDSGQVYDAEADKQKSQESNTSPQSESSCDSGYCMGSTDGEHPAPQPATQSPTTCDKLEYEKEYSTIRSKEQRDLYKKHFNAEYQEYLLIHKKINETCNKFEALESNIKTCTQGSEKYNEIKVKIYEEYRACQKDNDFKVACSRFNFLHNKLAFIKQLVTQYDSTQLAS